MPTIRPYRASLTLPLNCNGLRATQTKFPYLDEGTCI